MNHIYRLIWNRTLGALVPVAEITRSKHGGPTRQVGARHLRLAPLSIALAVALTPTIALARQAGLPLNDLTNAVRPATVGSQGVVPPSSHPLPVGGQVVSGTVTLGQSGSTLTIDQSSQKAIIDWQSFDIGSGDTVTFNQPGRSAVALNRVLGTDPSAIYGHLDANGQVFLVNPYGVYFAPGAQVDVGGIVASTLGITNQDFLSGRYRFSGSGTAGVRSDGTITAMNGGYVAFIGSSVDNTGTIATPGGTTAMGAGSNVTLTLADDSLVSFQVSGATLDALAKNGGLIDAGGGRVILSAQAKDALLQTVVNNTGRIQAQTVENHDGTITLLGGDSGTVHVAGTLDASAPDGGDGGAIDTSGTHVKVADSAIITTKAASGADGHWLIDPQDFTIAASGGDITGATLSGELAGGNVTIQSTAGATSGSGDINVDDTVSWNANTLTLDAYRNININTAMDGSSYAGLALEYGQGSTNGTIGGTTATYDVNAPVNLASSGSFSTKLGSAGSVVNYTIITSLGAAGSTTGTDLQGVSGNLTANYVLGANIVASPTSGWNSGKGFAPIGDSSTHFIGIFEGLGHTISGLTISSTNGTNYGGLFGNNAGTLRDVGLVGGSISYPSGQTGALAGYNTGTISHAYASTSINSGSNAGGLVGSNHGTISNSFAEGNVHSGAAGGGLVGSNHGTILNAYATGSVNGHDSVGGLAGSNHGTISNAYATGNVSANSFAGGLVGQNAGGTISNAYATGDVSSSYSTSGNNLGVGGLIGVLSGGTVSDVYATGRVTGINGINDVGGLVGWNTNGTVSNAYATGTVSSGGSNIGALVGRNNKTLTNGYWDTTTAGLSTGYGSNSGTITGGGGLTTAELAAALPSGFSSSNWADGTDVSGTGQTTPYLLANASFGTVGGHVILGSDSSATPTYFNVIQTLDQLQNINSTGLSGDYVLGNDIDASATTDWNSGAGFVPIGTSSNAFTGIFDGLGYTISGLTINRPSTDYIGLFGYTAGSNSVLRNIGLIGGSISAHDIAGELVGLADATTISHAYATGNISGAQDIGGLVGGSSNHGTLSDAYATGSVNGTSIVGGLIGESSNATVSNVYATGHVSGSDVYVGGLMGWNLNGVISNAYATGNITGDTVAGGLVGLNSKGTISNTYATGSVSGTNSIGGLIGANSNGGTATDSYWDTTTGGPDNGIGTGLTTSQLAAALPTGFDSSVWANGADDSGTGQTTPYLLASASFDTVGGHVILASDSSATPTYFNVIQTLDQLQDINSTGLSGDYVLGNDIDASATSGWNSGAGFVPIGNGSTFKGVFDGLGHTISNLTINRPGSNSVGLFGYFGSGGVLRNVGLIDASITGHQYVGALGGQTDGGSVSNAYATGQVSGSNYVGGLVGVTSSATISNAYTTDQVDGGSFVGGLVGSNYRGTISNAYATGQVSGSARVGGLVGSNYFGSVSNAYAVGSVSGSTIVGELIGGNSASSTITDGYWDTTTGLSAGIGSNAGTVTGGGGLTTAQLTTALPSGFASGIWANGDNQTTPYLLANASLDTVGGHVILGTDTSTTPTYYDVIQSLGQLQNINSTGLSGDYVLGNDIDASASSGWNSGTGFVPIGTASNAFGGVFDGLGHTITGLTIDRPSVNNVGLFGDNTGTLRNIGLTGGSITGGSNVGGLVGMNDHGTLDNAHASNTVSGTSASTNSNIGGLVGYSDHGTISNAYTDASITATGSNYDVGGLLGHSVGDTLSNVYASGRVDGFGNDMGGLIGLMEGGTTLSDAHASGDVIGGHALGGLVGSNVNGTISNAYATGHVDGVTAGGLVGFNGGTISNAYATGSITSPAQGGGLVGSNSDGTISNAYATGDVTDSSNIGQDLGGLVGFSGGGTLSNVYAMGNLSSPAATAQHIGGLIGQSLGDSVTDAYATGNVSGHDQIGGLIGLASHVTAIDVYATGSVSGTSNMGGLIGLNDADSSITDGYWDTTTGLSTGIGSTTGGATVTGGGGLTTAQLAAALPTGFDSSVWANSDDQITPYLLADASFDTVGGHVILGTDTSATPTYYNVILSATQLQDINSTGLSGDYVLGKDIDASATSGWNSNGSGTNQGLVPIGTFTGIFDGLGYTISGLTIDRPSTNYVGLFSLNEGTISDLGLVGVSVTGYRGTGGLVGSNRQGTISDVYVTGSVDGGSNVGGLAGYNAATISDAYSTVSVTGLTNVGGLVGYEFKGKVSNAYTTGNVLGSAINEGGLVGGNYEGTISNVYATGNISGGGNVGGLIGYNIKGTLTNGYWDTTTTGLSTGIGGTNGGTVNGGDGLSTAQLASNLPNGFDSSVWTNSADANGGGQTTPYLLANASLSTVSGSVILGSDSSATPTYFDVITTLDQLQDINSTGLSGDYVLGNDIDASATASWNGGAGFVPIGSNSTHAFSGAFDGLGFTIDDLTINRSSTDDVGLFGYNSGTLSDIGVTGGNINGHYDVGGLVGWNDRGTISDAYATTSVNGSFYIGGLIGNNDGGTVTNAYATGNVNGNFWVGGLIGTNANGTVTDTYATGNVFGSNHAGGLLGSSGGGSVANAYATGDVSGYSQVGGLIGIGSNTSVTDVYATGAVSGNLEVGGLIGTLAGSSTITDGYWDTTTGLSIGIGSNTGGATVTGGGGLTTAQLGAALPAGFDSSVWANGNDQTIPYLLANASFDTIGGHVILGSDSSATPTYYDVIQTLRQLQAINSSGLSGDYVLGNDINAADTASWNSGAGFVPIGNGSTYFTGTFDGLGHTITGLTIDRPSISDVGLFGYSTGTLRDIGLTGASITGGSNVGGLVGMNDHGTISNAYAIGDLSGNGTNGTNIGGLVGDSSHGTLSHVYAGASITATTSNSNVGGLVGYSLDDTLSNVYATGTISDNGNEVGGLIGLMNRGSLSDAHASGDVSGNAVGGLVGSNSNGTISRAYATGTVSGSRAGGLIGVNKGGMVSNVYATGSVSGSEDMGGLVGSNQGSISDAYATGSVSGTSSVGGLVGYNATGTIAQTYATGSVSGGNNVGGLIGWNTNAMVTDVYATSSVTGTTHVGGLVGLNSTNSTVTDGYWDTTTGLTTGIGSNTGGATATGGGGLTTAQLATALPSGFGSSVWANGADDSGTGQTTPYLLANASFDTVGGHVILGSDASATPTYYDVIQTLDQLQDINSTGLSGDYVLGNDIDASATTGWNSNAGFVPIGTGTNAFTGTFDGLGFTVDDLTINRPSTSGVGLFGHVYGGMLRNVGLVEANVSGGTYDVGGLIGSNTGGTVSNAYVTGSINGHFDVGGLIGSDTGGSVSNAYATSSISGYADVGGLIGSNDGGTISNAYASGNANGTFDIGGLIGLNSSGTLSNAYATGGVSGSGQVGGLVGSNTASTLSNVYATGAVSGTANLGGLIGSNNGGTLTDGYWDTTTGLGTGIGSNNGGTVTGGGGLTTAQLAAALPTGFSSSDWANGGDQTTPYLLANASFSTIGGHVILGSDSNATPTYFNVIQTLDQLQAVNTVGLSSDYVLGNDIDASATASWNSGAGFVPLGSNGTNAFSGIFDGLGHTISNLTVNRSGTSNVGLFGVSSGTLRDIGLVGGSVSGDGYVGDLVGKNSSGTITDAYATGSVSGNYDVGGLAGDNAYGTISNAYATGSVSGNYEVGGLVSSNAGTITDAYATGSVSGTNYAGGLASWNTGSIIDAYATGSVSGNYYAGGLVGGNSGSISNVYATGSVSGSTNVGELAGGNYYNITNGYWDTTTGISAGYGSNTGSVTGGGMTTAQLASSLPSGFTTSNWANSSNQTTPYLVANESFSTVSGAAILGSDGGVTPTVYGVITGLDQLQNIHSTDASGDYLLGNNIDASATASWNSGAGFAPIGTFGGIFDGLNHTISDLTINRPGNSFLGLFGRASNAAISNLVLANVNITGNAHVGALLGQSTNSSVSDVSVASGSVTGGAEVGALVGYNSNGTISNAHASASVSGNTNLGGLVGENTNAGTINDAYATGNVSGAYNIGGLVGGNGAGASITNAYATGNVSGSQWDIGGLVGVNGADISDAYASGNVSGGQQAGGLVGENATGGTIDQAYATGAVSGTALLGGLLGENFFGTVNNAYATGNVSGSNTLGGLAGAAYGGTIGNVYATGKVSGTSKLGGLIGVNGSNSDITNGYWDTTTTGRGVGIGSRLSGTVTGGGLATTQLAVALPAGFSSSDWANGDNQTTPYLLANASFDTVGGRVILGSDASATPTYYDVVQTLSQLQDINSTGLSGDYVLGNDIDASATASWNGGLGFAPIGNTSTQFTGIFDGLGHTISDLTINRPSTNFVGLFGDVGSNSVVRDIGLLGGSIRGKSQVGALIGRAYGFSEEEVSISNAYATSDVTGSNLVGGLIGLSYYSDISSAYASGSVTGSNSNVGGLVGSQDHGTISNAYANGAVSGSNLVGGLVGFNNQGAVSNVYTNGSVSLSGGSPFPSFGALVGLNSGGSIINGYWDTTTGPGTGIGTNIGGTVTGGGGLTSTQMLQQSSFSGFDFSSPMWVIYDSHTAPLLNAFLTPLTVTADDRTQAYDGNTFDLSSPTYSVSGADTSGHLFGLSDPYDGATDVGTYNADLWSDQQGYRITVVGGALTIAPRALTVTGLNGTDKTYDGSTSDPLAGTAVLNGLVGSETLTLGNTASGTLASANAGSEAVTTALTLSDGAGLANNYTLVQPTLANVTVDPAVLTVTGLSIDNKVYDGSNAATVGSFGSLLGTVATDSVSLVSGNSSASFANANVGTGKTVTISGLDLAGIDAGNYTIGVATATADITPRTLSVVLTGNPTKAYDGTNVATLGRSNFLLTGFVVGQGASVTQTMGTYASNRVGTGIQVTAVLDAGDYLADKGTLLSNYTLPTAARGPGMIVATPYPVDIEAAIASATRSTARGYAGIDVFSLSLDPRLQIALATHGKSTSVHLDFANIGSSAASACRNGVSIDPFAAIGSTCNRH